MGGCPLILLVDPSSLVELHHLVTLHGIRPEGEEG